MYQNKRTRLGFIGIGLMGKPMVLRLLAADYEVHAWNRSPDAIKEVTSAGAVPSKSPAQTVSNANVIFLCLANTDVVRAVVSDQRFLDALSDNPGRIIVDHSSISPDVTTELAALVGEHGAKWIDAPVSGGVPGAEQGSLVVMAGGDEETLDQVRPVIGAMATRVTWMGPTGSGQTTKLCNQIIVGCNISAIAEAIRLAQAAGVDASRLPAALEGGFADSLPFQIFGKRMAEGTETPVSIKIETMLKDLDGAAEAADNKGVAAELTDKAAGLMRSRVEAGDAVRCITSLVGDSRAD